MRKQPAQSELCKRPGCTLSWAGGVLIKQIPDCLGIAGPATARFGLQMSSPFWPWLLLLVPGALCQRNTSFPLTAPFWPEAAAFARCIFSEGDSVHTKELEAEPFVLMIIRVSSENKHLPILIASSRVLPLDHPSPSLFWPPALFTLLFSNQEKKK